MKVKKGETVEVFSSRKGRFKAVAEKDFDTDKETFYPLVLKEPEIVRGMANEWCRGERIPCRGSLCTISKMEE